MNNQQTLQILPQPTPTMWKHICFINTRYRNQAVFRNKSNQNCNVQTEANVLDMNINFYPIFFFRSLLIDAVSQTNCASWYERKIRMIKKSTRLVVRRCTMTLPGQLSRYVNSWTWTWTQAQVQEPERNSHSTQWVSNLQYRSLAGNGKDITHPATVKTKNVIFWRHELHLSTLHRQAIIMALRNICCPCVMLANVQLQFHQISFNNMPFLNLISIWRNWNFTRLFSSATSRVRLSAPLSRMKLYTTPLHG